jgi:hypothetical protein
MLTLEDSAKTLRIYVVASVQQDAATELTGNCSSEQKGRLRAFAIFGLDALIEAVNSNR